MPGKLLIQGKVTPPDSFFHTFWLYLFSSLVERLKGESWAERLVILDSDFNRHLVFRAQGKAGSVLESSPISTYNLKRLTTSEMIGLVRSSLVAPSEQT